MVRAAAASEHIIPFLTSALFTDSLTLTTDLLSLLTHVARACPEHLPFLQRILRGSDAADQPLTRLLGHRQHPIRAKTCSLLGNLLRHGHGFPQELQSQPGVLESLLGCLADQEASVRKAASFAVGNAAYHTSCPAGTLGRAVPRLTRLLSDAQARTRCNAALALGNLGQRSAELGDLLMESRAPHVLLEVACRDPWESVREGALVALRSLSQHPGIQQVQHGDLGSFVGPDGAAGAWLAGDPYPSLCSAGPAVPRSHREAGRAGQWPLAAHCWRQPPAAFCSALPEAPPPPRPAAQRERCWGWPRPPAPRRGCRPAAALRPGAAASSGTGPSAFFVLLGLQPRPPAKPAVSALMGTLPVGSPSWKSACRPLETIFS